jgi:hypothetical protein
MQEENLIPQNTEQDTEQKLRAIEPVINRILGSKLHVRLASMFPPYGGGGGNRSSEDYLKAEDLRSIIMLEILDKLKGTGAPIRELEKYATTVTRCEYAEFFRDREYTALGQKLDYYLKQKGTGFARWKNSDNKTLCGFLKDNLKDPLPGVENRLNQLSSNFRSVLPDVLVKGATEMNPDDMKVLLDSIFRFLQGPVQLNRLVYVIAPVAGVDIGTLQDRKVPIEDGPDGPNIGFKWSGPEDAVISKELVGLGWNTILALPRQQRVALLLNFKIPPTKDDKRRSDTKRRRERTEPGGGTAEIQLFNGIGEVPVATIYEALEIDDEQFELFQREVASHMKSPAVGADLATREDRFDLLWKQLPLKDKVIEKCFDVHGAAVCRKRAIERLREQCGEFLSYRGRKRMN